MPKIQISQKHNKPTAEIRKRLEELNSQFIGKYGFTSRWISDNEAQVERAGSKGTISFTDTDININLDLAFILSPLKGTIEKAIRDELNKSL